jgi:hypothetical protein
LELGKKNLRAQKKLEDKKRSLKNLRKNYGAKNVHNDTCMKLAFLDFEKKN